MRTERRTEQNNQEGHSEEKKKVRGWEVGESCARREQTKSVWEEQGGSGR